MDTQHPLKAFREGRRLKQPDIAKLLKTPKEGKVDVSVVSRIEKGIRIRGFSPLEILKQLKSQFNDMSTDEILLFEATPEERIAYKYDLEDIESLKKLVATFPDGVCEETIIELLRTVQRERRNRS